MKYTITMAILATASILVACTSDTLTVRSLTITDSKGERRVHLYAEEDTSRIDMFDSEGKTILSLRAQGDTTLIFMSDRPRSGTVVLSASPKSQILTFGAKAKSRLNIANFNTHSQIEVGPSEKGRSIYLSTLDSGSAGIILHDGIRQRGGFFLDLRNRTTASIWSATGGKQWQVP